MKTLKVLQKTRSLIEAGWCKDDIARAGNRVVDPLGVTDKVYNKEGKVVSEKYVPATSWSLMGALLAASGNNYQPNMNALIKLQQVVRNRGFTYLADFDNPDKAKGKTTQQDVLDLIDEAINMVK